MDAANLVREVLFSAFRFLDGLIQLHVIILYITLVMCVNIRLLFSDNCSALICGRKHSLVCVCKM